MAVILIIESVTGMPRPARVTATIENPCMRDETSTALPVYEPLAQQIRSTRLQANRTWQTYQELRDSVGRHLTASERNRSVPGVPEVPQEPNLPAANVFTRTLRHIDNNITLVYSILDRLTENNALQSFNMSIREAMSAIIIMRCRISTTILARKSNFTLQEQRMETEMELHDHDLFETYETSINQHQLPHDSKSIMLRVYSLAGTMQVLMNGLKDALDD